MASRCPGAPKEYRMHDHHHADPAPPPSGSEIWTLPDAPADPPARARRLPICGMALEPLRPAAGDGPNPELIDFTRRFRIAAALSLPLLIVSMGAEMTGIHLVAPAVSPWLQLALAAPVVLWAGRPSSSAAGSRWWTAISTCSR
ncbi:MAG: hypothetical protein WDN24_15125 [Sphingomonas sp.]